MKEHGQYKVRRTQHHILVVDDESHFGLFVEALLASRGYRVSLSCDSMDALSRFTSHPWMFDLVLTDQNMPKMGGIELAKNLRLIRPEVPIILCSGLGTEDMQALLKDMTIACLSKPLRAIDLLNLIEDKLKCIHVRDGRVITADMVLRGLR